MPGPRLAQPQHPGGVTARDDHPVRQRARPRIGTQAEPRRDQFVAWSLSRLGHRAVWPPWPGSLRHPPRLLRAVQPDPALSVTAEYVVGMLASSQEPSVRRLVLGWQGPPRSRPSASPGRPRVSAKATARRSRASVSPRRGPNPVMIRWAGPRHGRKRAVVPTTAMTSKPVTASHSGNFPAATRSPTVNITRSAGSGIGTPASIGRSRTRASGPLRPARPPFISYRYAGSAHQPRRVGCPAADGGVLGFTCTGELQDQRFRHQDSSWLASSGRSQERPP